MYTAALVPHPSPSPCVAENDSQAWRFGRRSSPVPSRRGPEPDAAAEDVQPRGTARAESRAGSRRVHAPPVHLRGRRECPPFPPHPPGAGCRLELSRFTISVSSNPAADDPHPDVRPPTTRTKFLDAAAALRQVALQADRAGVLSANEVLDEISRRRISSTCCASFTSPRWCPGPALPTRRQGAVAAEAADALEAFLRRCEVHDLLTPEAKRQREGLKQQREAKRDPGTARADKVAGFRRERAIRARLEELESTRRRRAEEALLNADWDDEDPDASPRTRSRSESGGRPIQDACR